jgi:alginate O-acetyltransferase complex protein AlgI
MLFNSYAFIFGYLPVTLAGFFLLARSSHRLASLWLAAASLFFYGWWNPVFVVLVMASITVNYAFGYAIGHVRLKSEKKSKTVLTVAVVTNLGLPPASE